MKTPQPSTLSRTLALVPPAIALLGPQTEAAFTAYLKIDSIPGESTDKGYEGWIKIQSASWGVGRAVSSATGGTDREPSLPSISEVSLVKEVDKTSPRLFLEAVAGTSLAVPVKLELMDQTTGRVFYRLTLDNVLVTSQSFTASTGGDRGSESLSLNFTKIKVEVFDAKGTLISNAGYDLELAKSF